MRSPAALIEAPTAGFALSPQQSRLWQLDGPSGNSRTSGTIEITGELDVTTLTAALGDVVERYEILRTHCRSLPGSGVPVQVVNEVRAPELLSRDLRSLIPREAEAQVLEGLTTSRLTSESPLSAVLCQVGEVRYLLGLDLSALCADQPTLAIVARELADAYARRLDPSSGAASEPLQYADIAEWQNQLLESEETSGERHYWRDRGAGPRLEIPFLRDGASEETSWNPRWQDLELEDRVPDGSELNGAAPESFLLACWAAFLGRMSGQREVPVAVAFHGRNYEELEGTPGPLTRFLPMSFRVSFSQPLATLERTVGESLEEAREYQEYFDGSQAGLTGSQGEPRFLDAAFEFCTASAARVAGTRFELIRGQSAADRFRLKLSALRSSRGLHLRLHYDADVLSEETARRFLAAFARLLASAARNPRSAAGDLELVPESEWRRLDELNDTEKALAAPATLHGRFEDQAAQHPDRTALLADSGTLTFGELEARANRLARQLRRLGVGPEKRVAVCTERSLERIVGVLGVLKSGAGYVPLDPNFPAERLAFILDDCGAEVLLAEPHLLSKLPAGARQESRLVLLDGETGSGESPERPKVEVAPENVAYVIYTSGSTGRPKGVVVRHRGIAERIAWVQSRLSLDAGDRVLHKAPFAFDVSVREIFWPLSTGAALVMAPQEADRDLAHLAAVMAAQRVSVTHFVPSLLAVFLEEEGTADLVSLRHVISGGEDLPPAVAERFRKLSRAELHNSYGPTEVSIHATFFTCTESPEEPMPIGRPLANTTAWVVDPRLWPVFCGVTGELVIGGAGLARGYRNGPGSTAERFVPNPWSRVPGERLYRTGDLARLLNTDRLQWCGRVDDQLKVRGFRVEPAEIEAVLVSHPAISQAVVIASASDGETVRLAAYVVATETPEPSAEQLRPFLAERLPAFMVPAAFRTLESLPRTATGKLDRRALPAFSELAAQDRPVYAAPRTAVEKILVQSWAEILGVERIGLHDDFFAQGGNSILATQLASRVRRAFRLEVPLREMFEAVTVAEMAELLSRYEPVSGQNEKIASILQKIKTMDPQARQALEAGLTKE